MANLQNCYNVGYNTWSWAASDVCGQRVEIGATWGPLGAQHRKALKSKHLTGMQKCRGLGYKFRCNTIPVALVWREALPAVIKFSEKELLESFALIEGFGFRV